MNTNKLLIDQLTTRELGFISDPDLTLIIEDILNEIDRVFSVSGFRSALYLSISAVEGILKHILELNLKEAKLSSKYPKNKNGTPKKIEDLTLFECIPICSAISLIPPELRTTYDHLRQFRNYIHPKLELSSKYKINIGISELGIGILNITLLHFDKLRFIEGSIWKVISGNPKYTLSDNQLILPRYKTRTHSFIITDYFTNKNFGFEFNALLSEGAIINFVYNFSSDDSFNMIRIDKRKSPDDGLLICTDKLHWRKKSKFKVSPTASVYNHKILIKVVNNSLKFKVDDDELEPKEGSWDYNPNMQIGFFNEERKVTIEKIKIII